MSADAYRPALMRRLAPLFGLKIIKYGLSWAAIFEIERKLL